MPANLGMIALGKTKTLEKRLLTLEGTQALRDRELELFFNTVSAMTDKQKNLEDRIEEITQSLRKQDIQPAEKSESSIQL